MAVYQSTEQLYAVMNDLFHELAAHSDHIDEFVHSNMVVRIVFEDPEGEILLDGRQPPLEFFLGPAAGQSQF